MTSFPLSRRDRRLAAFGMTALVHALLVLGWQAARLAPPRQADVSWVALRWIVPPARPAPKPVPMPSQARPTMPNVPQEKPAPQTAVSATPAPRTAPAEQPATAAQAAAAQVADVPEADVPQAAVPSDTPAKAMLERALRDAGAVDRALRKESRPLIVAPRDSPQIRLRQGLEAAAEMAPNAWYQTPKMAELVNSTGDGARRTRVIGGTATYCMTERSTNSSVDTIEKHGKWRWTTCPKHEAPAKPQEWRTARDP